jgi:hypothetical protein
VPRPCAPQGAGSAPPRRALMRSVTCRKFTPTPACGREPRHLPSRSGFPGPGPARTGSHPHRATGGMLPYRVEAPWADSSQILQVRRSRT